VTQNRTSSIEEWNGEKLPLGSARDVLLDISESYSSMTVQIPIHIRRASEPGPTVFVTAALHGDEINGTGTIRALLRDPEFKLLRGSLLVVPVLNMLAFDRHSRYLPDRRDLNRSFPGSASGTLASRMARKIFDAIVGRCDYGIDLHTAAVRRTNYPNVRADLSDPEVARMATAFGCEVVLDGVGPKGSLRREACAAGCPTIVMEGGEVWKVEPGIVESGVRGVKNVLRELGMIDCEPQSPDYQVTIQKTKWMRADRGGFLQFHVSAGDIVEKGQPLATNTTLLGCEQSVVEAPFHAVVVGMTTLPAINPGEPICNLGRLPKGTKPRDLRRRRSEEHGLEERVSDALGSHILVVERVEE
jgi:uncharacterized protein